MSAASGEKAASLIWGETVGVGSDGVEWLE